MTIGDAINMLSKIQPVIAKPHLKVGMHAFRHVVGRNKIMLK